MKLISCHQPTSSVSRIFGLLGLWMCSSPLLAVDGVIEINQARALAGGVTPGDAAGFPVDINQSGSYRLTSDLSVDKDATAIQIIANNVAIDLNGFSILGPNLCTQNIDNNDPDYLKVTCSAQGSGRGIFIHQGYDQIHIHNGSIRGMGDTGITRVNISTENADRFENLRISHCGGSGIYGVGGIYRHNIIQYNYGSGLGCSGSCLVEGNSVTGNGGRGIDTLGGTIINNVVSYSGDMGVTASSEAIIASNVVHNSKKQGIRSLGGQVTNNVASDNLDWGIIVYASGSMVTGNQANKNGKDGISVEYSGGGSVVGNTAIDNSQYGLRLDASVVYSQNNLFNNTGPGPIPQVTGGISAGNNFCNGVGC